MRRYGLHLAGVVGLCAVLGGCQTLNDLTGETGRRTTEGLPAALPPAPAQAAVPTPPREAPAGLAGLGSDRVIALWGEPTVRRREAGAELWTYGTPRAGCTVLVYFYPDAGGVMSVARTEALPGGTGAPAVAACARANALSPTS